MTWVYNNTKSLLLAVLFHASLTASSIIFLPTLPSAVDDLQMYLVFSALYWLVAAIVVAVAGVKRLVREPRLAQET